MALDFSDPVNMIVVGILSISVISLILVGGWAAVSSLPASENYAGNKSLDNIYDDAKGNDALSNAFLTSKIDISTEANSCSFLVTYKGNRSRSVECTTGCQGGPDDPNSKFCRQYIYKGGDDGNETGDLGEDLLDETYVRRRKAAQSDDDEPKDVTPEGSGPEGCTANNIKDSGETSCEDIKEGDCAERAGIFGGWGEKCSTCYSESTGNDTGEGTICAKNPNRYDGWPFWFTAITVLLLIVAMGVSFYGAVWPYFGTWSGGVRLFGFIITLVVVIVYLWWLSTFEGGMFIENSVKDDESICIDSPLNDKCDTKG